MSTTRVNLAVAKGGVAADPTSVKFSSADATWGVKRTDTNAIIVADDATFTSSVVGTWYYDITDPAYDLTYQCALEVVTDAMIRRTIFNISGTVTPGGADAILPQGEQLKLRSRSEDERMYFYRRVYDLSAHYTLPAQGATVTLDDVSGTGIMTPRVYGTSIAESKSGGVRATITFYQVRPYSGTPTAAGTELRGSRRGGGGITNRAAVRLLASNDGLTGLPTPGKTLYPADSGIYGRLCVDLQSVYGSPFPGLWYHVATYRAMRPYQQG